LTTEEVSFTQLKRGLNVNFVAIGLNIEQGQNDDAGKQHFFILRISALWAVI
jgi:hypothetical protein